MHPLCADEGIGVLPCSPLARGRLTRDWDVESNRSGTDLVTQGMYHAEEASNRVIADAVRAVADARGVSRAQVALAWVRQQPVVTAPIVGATKLHHLADAIAALELELTEDEIARLDAPYTPRLPEGF